MAGWMDLLQQFTDVHADADAGQVEQAAAQHAQETDPGTFQQSVQQGVQTVPDQQVGGIAGILMNALKGAGTDTGAVAQQAGLSSAAPHEMNKGDLTNLLGYVQQYAPGILGKVLSSHPEVAQALGGTVVKDLLGKLTG